MSAPPPGTGYYVGPADPGPGILLLAGSWGLTRGVKDTCEQLADLGYTVLAPDLADGQVASSEAEAMELLAEADMNVNAALVGSSARLLLNITSEANDRLATIGWSSGASWALWMSVRMPDLIRAVVTFYGTQSIAMATSDSSYLAHFASDDDLVGDDEIANLGLNLQLAQRPFRFEHHEGTQHGFAETHTAQFNAQAEAVAWRQTLEFLASEHPAN